MDLVRRKGSELRLPSPPSFFFFFLGRSPGLGRAWSSEATCSWLAFFLPFFRFWGEERILLFFFFFPSPPLEGGLRPQRPVRGEGAESLFSPLFSFFSWCRRLAQAVSERARGNGMGCRSRTANPSFFFFFFPEVHQPSKRRVKVKTSASPLLLPLSSPLPVTGSEGSPSASLEKTGDMEREDGTDPLPPPLLFPCAKLFF